MPRTTTARRIALLSSSSLGLAAIVTAASLGAALTPTAAAAQVATCTVGVTPQAGASVVVPAGTHNPNITCVYTGDAATVTTAGSITVSSAAPGGGVNLSATGTDDVNWTSTAGTVTGGSQTNGPVIEALTQNGDINLTTATVSGNNATVTHGIRAVSSGAGAITLSTGGVTANSTGGTAIFADSNGGDIDITTSGTVGSASGNYASPVLRNGIVAETSGAGGVRINTGGTVFGSGPAGAAISVSNGTGDVLIEATSAIRGGNHSSSTNQMGAGIVVDSDGDVTVNSSSLIMGAINVTGPRPAAITASGQTFTLNLTGNPDSVADAPWGYAASLGGVYLFGQSGTPTAHLISGFVAGQQDVASYTGGHIDLSGVTAGAELNFESRARWVVTGESLMSGAADTVNLDATSVIMTTGTGQVPLARADVTQTLIPPGVIDFGGGVDAVNNAGRILISPIYMSPNTIGTGPDRPPQAEQRFGWRGELRLLNLEEFNNSGDIWLGVTFFGQTVSMTDRMHDDMLYMPGAAFHGAEGSRLFMDVNLDQAQTSCSPSTRDGEGYLPAADCIGLQGGSATGRTEVRIYEQVPGDRGAYNPDGIVLVDIAGGDPDATAPDAFFLSPETDRYLDIGLGGIEKGVFAYIMGYDAEDNQFKLYGVPSSGGLQFPILATAANQLWQTATGGWFERRVHQRDVGHEGLGTGAWFNVTGVGTERDIATSVMVGSDDVVFDNSYEQSDVTISFGWDLLDYGSNAALGAMFGYAHSEVEFEDSDNSANLEGVHAGIYGGYGIGGFWIDAALNGAILSLQNEVPALALEPAGTLLDTEVWSLGGRVEAGWRFNAMGGLWLEPLLGASMVSTSFEDMRVPNDDPDPNRPGVSVRLDSAESRRASAGLRFGVTDMWANVAPTSFSLTARAINEFEGGANVSVENVGPTYLSTDALEGTFTQVTGSVSVASPNKAISGYLNLDTVKGDDYDSLGASIGVRLHW